LVKNAHEQQQAIFKRLKVREIRKIEERLPGKFAGDYFFVCLVEIACCG
jgi:hypothetical protein